MGKAAQKQHSTSKKLQLPDAIAKHSRKTPMFDKSFGQELETQIYEDVKQLALQWNYPKEFLDLKVKAKCGKDGKISYSGHISLLSEEEADKTTGLREWQHSLDGYGISRESEFGKALGRTVELQFEDGRDNEVFVIYGMKSCPTENQHKAMSIDKKTKQVKENWKFQPVLCYAENGRGKDLELTIEDACSALGMDEPEWSFRKEQKKTKIDRAKARVVLVAAKKKEVPVFKRPAGHDVAEDAEEE